MGTGIAVNLDLTKESAIGYRVALGIDPKDRVTKNVRIEEKLLQIHKEHNRGTRDGALSNDINIGLNLLYASRGWI